MVIGASEHTCHSIDDVVNLLKKGSTGRHTGATQMNDESSRSHAIFTLYIGLTSINCSTSKANTDCYFVEQRRKTSNSVIVQASYDGLVKPMQSKFDG